METITTIQISSTREGRDGGSEGGRGGGVDKLSKSLRHQRSSEGVGMSLPAHIEKTRVNKGHV